MHRFTRQRRRRRGGLFRPWLIVLLLAVAVWTEGHGFTMPTWLSAVSLDEAPQPPEGARAGARTLSPRNVVDGDTVRLRGQTFRLVGFNTPETGDNARCSRENDLGHRATARLQSLIRTASEVELMPVQCSCRPGTHGTSECNYGRACGILHVDGRDVGSVLIAEGLARPFTCGAMGCPQRRPWC